MRVFITGASSGLGQQLAILLARKENQLLLTGRSESKLKETLCKIDKSLHGRVTLVPADLSTKKGQEELLAYLKSSGWDELDLFIHAAGSTVLGEIEKIPFELWNASYELNFNCALRITQMILPPMKKKNRGGLVYITSGVARRSLPFEAPYCLAKAALNAFCDSLLLELSRTSIQVLNFSPGPLDTPFTDNCKSYLTLGRKTLITATKEDPKKIAKKLLKALNRKEERVTLGWRVKVIHFLNSINPKIVDLLLKTLYVRKFLKQ